MIQIIFIDTCFRTSFIRNTLMQTKQVETWMQYTVMEVKTITLNLLMQCDNLLPFSKVSQIIKRPKI